MEERILNHLKTHGSITSWDAIKEYGCTRLSHYIWALRKDGYKITDERIEFTNRYGEKSNCKKYIYQGE